MSFHFRMPWSKPTPLPDIPIRGQHGQFSPSLRTRRQRSRSAQVKAQLVAIWTNMAPEQRKAAIERAKGGVRG